LAFLIPFIFAESLYGVWVIEKLHYTQSRCVDPTEVDLMQEWTIVIMVLTSLGLVSGTSLFGYWLKLRYQYRDRPRAAEQLNEIREALDQLQRQLETQTNELHERLDFAERLLTRGADQRGEIPESTPV
jgi:hypothetical protein